MAVFGLETVWCECQPALMSKSVAEMAVTIIYSPSWLWAAGSMWDLTHSQLESMHGLISMQISWLQSDI